MSGMSVVKSRRVCAVGIGYIVTEELMAHRMISGNAWR